MLREGLLFLSDSRVAKKLITGTPVTRSMSRRFVPGETVDDLVRAAREANAAGMTVTANYLGESVDDEPSARAAAAAYVGVLDRVAAEALDGNVSVKLTQLGQDLGEDVFAENLARLLERGRRDGLFIRLDMESSEHTQLTLETFETLWSDGWTGVGVVLQSYLRRSAADVARMNELGVRVRLCKGAYAEPPEVAFQTRREVDRSFIQLMRSLLTQGHYPAIATHDDHMVGATVAYASENGVDRESFEFQMLHGVRRDLQRRLVREGYNVRVYIPFGQAWYPYLMRRLAERPANVLFMAGAVVRESPLGFLWPDRRKKGPE